MMYLRTGLPGASKTLNSLRELVLSQDESRPFYYHNIKLLMLDMEICKSFSGWFYGWFFPRLKDKAQRKKLIKIMKPIHDNNEFLSLNDVPWLSNQFEAHNHFDTWLYWVRRVYPRDKLAKLNAILDAVEVGEGNTIDLFDMVKPLNLHFNHFDNPNHWMELPKGSVILIDECQEFFPPRPVGSKVPAAVAAMEKHRHGGYDLHFVTQDATFSDQNIRKLIGRHVHYFNPFGGKRIVRFENPGTFNPSDYHAKKQAKKKPTAHATNFYGVYWSAEIHTHKFQFPKMAFVGLGSLLVTFLCFYWVYSFISEKAGFNAETEITTPAPPVESVPAPAPSPKPQKPSKPVKESERPNVEPAKNPLTIAYSNKSNLSDAETRLRVYLDELLEDVYISGSMVIYGNNKPQIDYTFYRSTDEAVFHPYDVGLTVEPLDRCLANVKLGEMIRLVTCDPFYKRIPVEDESDDLFGDSELASNNRTQIDYL